MKKLMMMALAAATMFSCSKVDEDNGGETPEVNSKSYINLSIANGVSTKATTPDVDNGDKDPIDGTTDENKINNVTIYFFDATSKKYVTNATYPITGGTTGPKPVNIALGTYNIFIVANGTAKGVTFSSNLTQDDFLKNSKYDGSNAIYTPMSDEVPNGGFIMASRTSNEETSGDKTSPFVKIVITKENNTEQKAAKPLKKDGVTENIIDMERVVGRLEIKAKNDKNEYTVTDKATPTANNIAKIAITDYQIVNQHKPFYTFRHVANDIKAIETDMAYTFGDATINSTNNYVVDPNTVSKTEPFVTGSSAWYYNQINTVVNTISTTGTYSKMTETTDQYVTIGYVNENTMAVNMQKRGYTTAIIYKATITPEATAIAGGGSYTAGNSLWFYGNKFYLNLADINAAGSWAFTTASTIADFAVAGVKYYPEGKCFYKYFIRHLDNKKPEEMGIMEFAIVRNNTYQMMVDAINAMGDPGDGEDPEDPDEKSNLYLNVTLKVLPWQVRSNVITFE